MKKHKHVRPGSDPLATFVLVALCSFVLAVMLGIAYIGGFLT